MRRRALIALFCALALACSKEESSKEEKRAASPCDSEPLAGLVAQYPVHVLCGAADFVPEAKAIADSTLGDSWQIDQPGYLAEHTDPARISAGLGQVCAMLDHVSPDARKQAASGIASWVDAYLALQQADRVSVEFFASAVVQVPEVRAAVPQDVIDRSPDGRVGDTMASSQFVALDYALTHILARMTAAERDRVLEEIRTRAVELLRSEE